ncbi:MAG TPA: rhodanese-like domain-containing protein [Candidatus Hydrogenedentes bacterium]|nr:rhodanese-like domain-containing protein [Candidatus Hydrogenedentota bacterium]HRK36377.1 rhodanese-like domain-containing protein [Candidatus Hydrogenedentota bacterium]
MTNVTITPAALHSIVESGEKVRLVDVRTPVEFRDAHVPFAENIPLEAIAKSPIQTSENGAPLYVICHSGQRAQKACEQLQRAGVLNAVVVEGGTKGWIDAGFDVVRGKKAVSLERQVRIVAGGLAFTGGILALLVHPYWAGLSAFVGAGLVFAGVTDTCGMAMVLARMPWNRVSGDGRTCSA